LRKAPASLWENPELLATCSQPAQDGHRAFPPNVVFFKPQRVNAQQSPSGAKQAIHFFIR